MTRLPITVHHVTEAATRLAFERLCDLVTLLEIGGALKDQPGLAAVLCAIPEGERNAFRTRVAVLRAQLIERDLLSFRAPIDDETAMAVAVASLVFDPPILSPSPRRPTLADVIQRRRDEKERADAENDFDALLSFDETTLVDDGSGRLREAQASFAAIVIEEMEPTSGGDHAT